MAVTELYVAQYLLSATLEKEQPLRWSSDEDGVFRSNTHGVSMELYHAHTMGWSGLCLSFRGDHDDAFIEEPRPSSFFGRNYRTRDDMLLAEALRALADAASAQCIARRERAVESRESIRESVYRQVLFGKP